MLNVKRVYDPPKPGDGIRILIDRLWPRGLKKEDARLDEWRKDLAPSDELRKWFGHEAEKWDEFKARYRRELTDAGKVADLQVLKDRSHKQEITVLYSAKEPQYNNAVALKEFIDTING